MSIFISSDAIPLNPLTPQATDVSWRDYPASIGGHNAITTAGKSLSDRLSGLSDVLFSDEIDLRIIDIWSDNGKYLSKQILRRRGLSLTTESRCHDLHPGSLYTSGRTGGRLITERH